MWQSACREPRPMAGRYTFAPAGVDVARKRFVWGADQRLQQEPVNDTKTRPPARERVEEDLARRAQKVLKRRGANPRQPFLSGFGDRAPKNIRPVFEMVLVLRYEVRHEPAIVNRGDVPTAGIVQPL